MEAAKKRKIIVCGTTIISGAVAERLKFFSYVIITFFASGFFYPIVGHWSWAFNFDDPTEKFGWLGKLGYLDFAGASVVHSVGGWIALSVLLIIGMLALDALLNSILVIYENSNISKEISITPFVQVVKLLLYFVTLILIMLI